MLKPGGYLLAFGGTRTEHRMTCAIEDAGFEIRDKLAWMHGQGFPKSARVNRDPRFCQCASVARSGESTAPELTLADHNDTGPDVFGGGLPREGVPRSTGKSSGSMGDCRKVCGFDDARAPRYGAGAPISSPSQECVQEHNRSLGHVDVRVSELECSPSPVPHNDHPSSQGSPHPFDSALSFSGSSPESTLRADTSGSESRIQDTSRGSSYGTGLPRCVVCVKPTAVGLGTALKPAHESIVVARKPLSENTVAANVLKHGTGALNIDGCRIPTNGENPTANRRASGYKPNLEKAADSQARGKIRDRSDPEKRAAFHPSDQLGRWPANVLLDEEAARMLDEQSGVSGEKKRVLNRHGARASDGWGLKAESKGITHADSGGASRFFYVAKPSASERDGSEHPTMKSIALMRWLVRLVTPTGGIVLDPFLGSGTTGIAALQEGFKFIGLEKEPSYVEIAERRIAKAAGGAVQ